MPPSTLLERLAAALAGRYEVLREIGRGGMATVYLARDLRHERRVALKVLSADLQSGVTPERFLTEIRTAANLSHPHVLPLFDSGEVDGLLYYVMPFVDGITLEEHIGRESRLEVADALRLIREIADGLAHAHRQGLVHRDVKPSNVLLSEGHALLMDFGIAKAVSGSETTGATQTGMTVGTPNYMSPEQARSSKDVDQRSDLYSLACVAYQMLVGELPYPGDNPLAVLAGHAFDPIPSARAVRAEVPEGVDGAIQRAMAKEPEDRFQTVQEFLDALSRRDAGGTLELPAPAPLPGRAFRLPRWGGWLAAAALAVGGAIVAVAAWPWASDSTVAQELAPARVVVAPLENRTGDPRLDEVGRMGADWITEGLHRTGIVDVVPSLSALQVAGYVRDLVSQSDTIDPIRALARETGAGKVISGSYYLDGDSLLFQLQVTDAIAGTLVDALDPVRGSPTAPSGAIGELRNRVMGSLAVSLDERLATVDLSSVQPPNFESYRAFDEGMERYVASDWRSSLPLFHRAFQADSSFVMPLLYAAFSHSNLRQMAQVDSLIGILDQRREELAPYHRHWLDYLEARTRGMNEEARLAMREAAALAPGSKAVYNYAYAAQLSHRPREAVEALRTLDPERGPMRGWLPYWTLLTDNLHRLGQHREELTAARRAWELYPTQRWPLRMEGEALAALGRTRDVSRLMETLDGVPGSDISSGAVMIAVGEELRFHGYQDEAEELFQRAVAWYEARTESEKGTRIHREEYAAALNNLRRFPEAIRTVRALTQEYPGDYNLLGWLGTLEAWSGNELEAERILGLLGEQERSDPYSRGSYALQQAKIAAVLGRREEATTHLRDSFSQGFRPLRHPDINLESLVGYAPFEEVMTPLDR